MKVNNNSVNLANVDAAKSNTIKDKVSVGKQNPYAAESTAIASSSQVNVSERAQSMQKAKEIATADVDNEAKIARLQKMIDAGEYKVNAEAIADRLVDEHLMTN